ncbi:MAG TPA: hypothetical protein VI685_20040 [Candidatus Angelobacter sp.]
MTLKALITNDHLKIECRNGLLLITLIGLIKLVKAEETRIAMIAAMM